MVGIYFKIFDQVLIQGILRSFNNTEREGLEKRVLERMMEILYVVREDSFRALTYHTPIIIKDLIKKMELGDKKTFKLKKEYEEDLSNELPKKYLLPELSKNQELLDSLIHSQKNSFIRNNNIEISSTPITKQNISKNDKPSGRVNKT